MALPPDSIAIVIPVLGRPQRAQQVVDSIRASTVVPYKILFVCSPGDTDQIQACKDTGCNTYVVDFAPGPGDYAKKINYGYRASRQPFVFTGADDLRFHPGWDTAALRAFSRDSVGVVGTNDLGNPRVLAGEHSTHSLIRRTYADTQGVIDKPGAIYAELYEHEFVDDELCATAMARGAWAFAADSVVEHLHPNWGKAPYDDLHSRAPQRLKQGRAVFRSRQKLWGRLPLSHAPISVIVATYGDSSWEHMAQDRAIPSAYAQRLAPEEVIVVHGKGLAEARNEGALKAKGSYLCFLDADDELHPGFTLAMSKMMTGSRSSPTQVLNPAVQFVMPDGKAKSPRCFRTRPLDQGNYLVIGTLVHRGLFLKAGGFDPQWEAWEDWALWRRVMALGGRVVRVPNAIYRAHWRDSSRNNTVADAETLRARIDADFAEWKLSGMRRGVMA